MLILSKSDVKKKLWQFKNLKPDFKKPTEAAKGSLTVWALYAYFSDSHNAAFEVLVWCM